MKLLILIPLLFLTGCEVFAVKKSHAELMIEATINICDKGAITIKSSVNNEYSVYAIDCNKKSATMFGEVTGL
jgi:hypothetical protein